MAQLVKNPPAVWETWVWSLGWEDPLEKGKSTHSSILAWRIPWTVVAFTFNFQEWIVSVCSCSNKMNTPSVYRCPDSPFVSNAYKKLLCSLFLPCTRYKSYLWSWGKYGNRVKSWVASNFGLWVIKKIIRKRLDGLLRVLINIKHVTLACIIK